MWQKRRENLGIHRDKCDRKSRCLVAERMVDRMSGWDPWCCAIQDKISTPEDRWVDLTEPILNHTL